MNQFKFDDQEFDDLLSAIFTDEDIPANSEEIIEELVGKTIAFTCKCLEVKVKYRADIRPVLKQLQEFNANLNNQLDFGPPISIN